MRKYVRLDSLKPGDKLEHMGYAGTATQCRWLQFVADDKYHGHRAYIAPDTSGQPNIYVFSGDTQVTINVPNPTFADLKPGDRFTVVNGTMVYTKLQYDVGHANCVSSEWYPGWVTPSDTVTPCS